MGSHRKRAGHLRSQHGLQSANGWGVDGHATSIEAVTAAERPVGQHARVDVRCHCRCAVVVESTRSVDATV
jgi:hypothetical protein